MEKVKVFYKQFSDTRIFCEHPKPIWKRVAFHGNVCEPFLLSKGCDGFRDRDFKSSLPLIFEINHAPTIPKKPLGAIFFSAGLQSWFGWASFSAFVSCKFRLYTCLFYIYKVNSDVQLWSFVVFLIAAGCDQTQRHSTLLLVPVARSRSLGHHTK